ncbi:MAG TPA: ribosomal protein L7/L12 [Sphingopyxis sp.]|nr:ribosomal protein L7/L12 [Sphingopyxis sp.]
MSGLLLFALGFFCGASLVLALLRDRGARDLTGPPPRAPSSPSRTISVHVAPATDEARAAAYDDAEILELIRRGRKIEAIKRMRELTGMGLAESNDAVETIKQRLR